MRFAVVQFDIAWEDKPANHARIDAMLDAADLPRGAFVLLPELGDTGFSFDLERVVDDTSMTWARKTAAARGIWLQAGYAVRGPDGRGRNAATIVSPAGEVAGTFWKVHPFSFGREMEHFTGGDSLLIADCDGVQVCPTICYDLRFPELWRHAVLPDEGPPAEVFTIGASWPAARRRHWRALLVARAIENQAFVVACNRCGRDPNLGYAGGSLIVAPTGSIVAEGTDAPAVLQADLDLEEVAGWRRAFPALVDVRRSLLGSCTVRRGGAPDSA